MLCEDCAVELTEENQKNSKTLKTLCDLCDAMDRDRLAYLTGTGRYAQ